MKVYCLSHVVTIYDIPVSPCPIATVHNRYHKLGLQLVYSHSNEPHWGGHDRQTVGLKIIKATPITVTQALKSTSVLYSSFKNSEMSL